MPSAINNVQQVADDWLARAQVRRQTSGYSIDGGPTLIAHG
jgi:hypothetical protein